MIRNIIIVVLVILHFSSLNGQINDLLFNNADSGTVWLNGSHLSGSNSISLEQFLDLRNGGYIHPQTLHQLEAGLKMRNTIGGTTSGELGMIYPKKILMASDTFLVLGNMGIHRYQEARFSENAGKLAIRGNHQFQGEYLPLSPLSYQTISYLQIKGGLMKVCKTDRRTSYAGFTFGLAAGLDFQFLKINQGTLYTAPFGEYLEMNGLIEYSQSNSDNNGNLSISGFGPTLDMFYALVPQSGPSFVISFTNLGFITWNRNTQTYLKDTIYRYEGITVDNLFNIGNDNGINITKDTLKEILDQYGNKGHYYTSLPLTAHVSVKQSLKGLPLTLRGDFMYRMNTLMKPYISLSVDWSVHERLTLSRTYSAGGYHGFANGIALQWNLYDHWWLHLGSNAIFPFYWHNSAMRLHFSGGFVYRHSHKNK